MLNMRFMVHDKDVERMLDRLNMAVSPVALAGFMQATVGPYLQQRAKARFRSEGDDASGKWAELSTTTHSFRINAGYAPDHPINRRTGRLENYITETQVGVQATASGGAQVTFPKNPPRGATAEKLRTAQHGRHHPRTVPRPVLAINETDMGFMITALHQYIQNAGKGGIL
jgi:hypothetical protein